MKKLYFLILNQLLYLSAGTQITITDQQIIQPNTEIYRSFLDTANFSPGPSGSNVLWDYSTINMLQLNAEYFHYLPSVSNCFNDNEINAYLNGGLTLPDYRHIYYEADANSYSFKGFCENDPPSNNLQLQFSDKQTFISVPFDYQETFTDSSAGILQGGIPATTHQINGVIANHYDAWGELRLPWGNYPNVARVRTTNFDRDSTYNSASGNGDIFITAGVGYSWYDANTHGEILYFGEGTSTFIPFNGTPSVNYYKVLFAQANLPLTDTRHRLINEPYFKIFPNPSDGIINIELELKTFGDVQLDVLDATGRVLETLFKDKLQEGSHIFNWNCGKGEKMPCFVRLQQGQYSILQKVICTN